MAGDRAEAWIEVAVTHEPRMLERQFVGIVAGLPHLGAVIDRDTAELDDHAEHQQRPREAAPPARDRAAERREGEGDAYAERRQDRHQVARAEGAVARPVLK